MSGTNTFRCVTAAILSMSMIVPVELPMLAQQSIRSHAEKTPGNSSDEPSQNAYQEVNIDVTKQPEGFSDDIKDKEVIYPEGSLTVYGFP